MKIYRYPSKSSEQRLTAIVSRGLQVSKKLSKQVVRIIEDVRKNGDQALMGYVNRFDAPALTADELRVSSRELDAAAQTVDQDFVKALDQAVAQITHFHELQRQRSWFTAPRDGVLLGQLVTPVTAAGVYVPGGQGGTTPLVSSVLMGAIPAKIAGVKRVVMVTPPAADGQVNPHLLLAARKVGVDAVYKLGSAWAIAALAFGTERIPKVDVIVGPGNLYVTLAKKILAGSVGIDLVAGPSEVLVVADHTADAEYIAADMLSQAEHDSLAAAMLITSSSKLARQVAAAVTRQLELLTRREIARESIRRYGAIMVVPDLEVAMMLVNRIAPEHLELHIADAFAYLGHIRNAGAVFLGPFTPEPVGDYIAGPNHVLPTGGTARFSSALGVDHFLKKTSLIHYSQTAFEREAQAVMRLAQTEGLDAHARSIKLRLTK